MFKYQSPWGIVSHCHNHPKEMAGEGRLKEDTMDDPQGMSALGEKKRNWVVARKREAVVAEREGERRGHLLSLWNMCMDNSGGLWLQDSCVLPTLTVYLQEEPLLRSWQVLWAWEQRRLPYPAASVCGNCYRQDSDMSSHYSSSLFVFLLMGSS